MSSSARDTCDISPNGWRPSKATRRKMLRRIFRGLDSRARDPEYQERFSSGFPDERCSDGLEYWVNPRLQATAPVLTVPHYDLAGDLLDGELELLTSFRQHLLEDDEDA
jgi:hypothetical protein